MRLGWGRSSGERSLLPRPALRGERVGVRGCFHKFRTWVRAVTPPPPPCFSHPPPPPPRGGGGGTRRPLHLTPLPTFPFPKPKTQPLMPPRGRQNNPPPAP